MNKKPWYNYWMPRYQSDEPNYFDARNFVWAQQVLEKGDVIKEELLIVLKKRNNKLFPYYSPAVSIDGDQWHTLAFKTWGIDVKPNLEQCPEISRLIEKIPQLVSASVNVLMPGAELKAHQGDSDSFYRCHLGIEIPEGLPKLGFEVEGEKKEWKEGELLIFLDAKEHRAWNNTDQRRVIFLFDVVREEYVSQQKKICFNIRSFLLMQWLAGKFPFLTRLNKKIHKIIFLKIKLLLILIYPYQKRKGVIIKHS